MGYRYLTSMTLNDDNAMQVLTTIQAWTNQNLSFVDSRNYDNSRFLFLGKKSGFRFALKLLSSQEFLAYFLCINNI